jgi:dihydrolipoamide dehydrogenase
VDLENFDLVVIGAGPGGYVAAIRGAQLGAKVALIEKELLGGTCLNVGCIPTKTLLSGAGAAASLSKMAEYGIEISSFKIHYDQMKKRKDRIIGNIRSNLKTLIESNQVEIIIGKAKLSNSHEIKVEVKDGYRQLYAKKIILATGSSPRSFSPFIFDGDKIHNSTTILEITNLPKVLAIVGGGYIGCEFASLFQALGVKVIIIEAADRLLSQENRIASDLLYESCLKRGIEVHTNSKVDYYETHENSVTLTLQNGLIISADTCLVAIGRKLNTENLGLETAGVFVNEKGSIPVNDRMQTNLEHIYAIGDITAKSMLAHVASHQAEVAAYNALSYPKIMDYHVIPAVIFTNPEIASVGLSLEKAQLLGLDAYVSQFPLQALGKAQAISQVEGFSQIVVEKKTQRLLGALFVGHEAGNLIAYMSLAIQNELTVECITHTIHAHPTLAESWHETALLAAGTPLHLPPKGNIRKL